MTEIAKAVPVAEGLYEVDGDGAHLLGTRCNSCGAHYFPKALSCRNPECRDKRTLDVRLGRRGLLYTWTVQSYRPPPLFRMDGWAPYAIGLVELPEGLRVMGMLGGLAHEDIRIGMALELAVAPLYRDESGRPVLTYQFRPAGAAAAVAP
jgi:uncharacterized OB-fold protein